MATRDTSALLRLRDGLKQHFGPGAAVFTDPFLWLLGCVCVDVVRLENWLMQRNPDYGKDESMRLFIRRKYGRSAERFVEYWLKGERREGLETGNLSAKGGSASGGTLERRDARTGEGTGVGTDNKP